jgi:hypothetical protein
MITTASARPGERSTTAHRLGVIGHLGLATAHCSRTDPEWLEDAEREVVRTLMDLQEMRGPRRDPDRLLMELLTTPAETP